MFLADHACACATNSQRSEFISSKRMAFMRNMTRPCAAMARRCGAAAVGLSGFTICYAPTSAFYNPASAQSHCKSMLEVSTPTASPMTVPSPAEISDGPSLVSKCIAEAIGTAIIVLGGCGSVCAVKYAGSNMTGFGIAAAWGIAVSLAVYTTRAVSGAELNPAVTIAKVVLGRKDPMEAVAYVGAQVGGAFVAGAVNCASSLQSHSSDCTLVPRH